jgi:uncharacterized membrane protein YiaA
MSFALYLVGYVIFIIGLSIGAHLLHVPPRWIAVVDIVLIGLAIVGGAKSTRQRDPS